MIDNTATLNQRLMEQADRFALVTHPMPSNFSTEARQEFAARQVIHAFLLKPIPTDLALLKIVKTELNSRLQAWAGMKNKPQRGLMPTEVIEGFVRLGAMSELLAAAAKHAEKTKAKQAATKPTAKAQVKPMSDESRLPILQKLKSEIEARLQKCSDPAKQATDEGLISYYDREIKSMTERRIKTEQKAREESVAKTNPKAAASVSTSSVTAEVQETKPDGPEVLKLKDELVGLKKYQAKPGLSRPNILATMKAIESKEAQIEVAIHEQSNPAKRMAIAIESYKANTLRREIDEVETRLSTMTDETWRKRHQRILDTKRAELARLEEIGA